MQGPRLTAAAVLFPVLFDSGGERSVRCSSNSERLVRLFAFVFGERSVVFTGLNFPTRVRCSHNDVRSQSCLIVCNIGQSLSEKCFNLCTIS